jgi:hypothetical protein
MYPRKNVDSCQHFSLQDRIVPFHLFVFGVIYYIWSMGLTKPRLEDFLLLVQKIDRRLSSTLSLAGRLQMVNAAFSYLPTYHMCSL